MMPKKLKIHQNILVVFSTGNERRLTINLDQGDLSVDPVVIEKGTVIRLLHLKPDMSGGNDDIHPSILKAGPLVKLSHVLETVEITTKLERRDHRFGSQYRE